MFGPCGVVVIGEMIAPAGSPVVTPACVTFSRLEEAKRDTHTHPRVDQRVYYTLWCDTGLIADVVCWIFFFIKSILILNQP